MNRQSGSSREANLWIGGQIPTENSSTIEMFTTPPDSGDRVHCWC